MRSVKSYCMVSMIALGVLAMGALGTAWVCAAPGEGEEHTAAYGEASAGAKAKVSMPGGENAAIYYAIAITVGISCLSAGYAVGKVGAAAMGAAAERPELMGRALIFVGLAEGIAIYGLIIGVMLILKL